MNRGKKILVTGGAGFIGANLVRMSTERGYRITVLDNLTSGRKEYLEGIPLEFTHGDILDKDLIMQIVPEHWGVIHLAAQTGVPGSLENPYHDCKTNVLGTLNLLEAVRIKGNGRFILASSNAPLGRQPPPATEEKAPLPISPYGASKLAAEAYCLAYNGSWGLGTIILRFGNVYGRFSAHKNSVVAKFFKDILTKREIIVHGDGYQTRDFIYVEDLCLAILKGLESSVSGEVFQISTGVETTIIKLATLVEEVVRQDVGLQYDQPRRGDIRKNYSEINKVREMLGWEPKVVLRDGLREVWEWFQRWGS